MPVIDDDDLDPEFYANLDETGRQNLADTENIIQTISAQSRQNSSAIPNRHDFIRRLTTRQERERIFRDMSQAEVEALPQDLQAEALILRTIARNNSQNQFGSGPVAAAFANALRPQSSHASNPSVEERARSSSNLGWNQVRSRLQSIDHPFDDISDLPREQQAPQPIEVNIGSGNINATLRFLPASITTEIAIADNRIFSSFQEYLRDQLSEMASKPFIDQRGIDINQAVEGFVA